MWNVTNFSNRNDWPANGKPFVYSMNLGGSAAHGDYVFGWKDQSLQLAMDNKCNLNQAVRALSLSLALSPRGGVWGLLDHRVKSGYTRLQVAHVTIT